LVQTETLDLFALMLVTDLSIDGKVLFDDKDTVVHAKCPLKNILQSQNNIPPASISLIPRGRFQQNEPASPHVRKEPII
jgi:hypothetical protein